MIYFLLLERKLKNPCAEDTDEVVNRSRTVDAPRKRVDKFKTSNGHYKHLAVGSPVVGRRGISISAHHGPRHQSCHTTPLQSPCTSPSVGSRDLGGLFLRHCDSATTSAGAATSSSNANANANANAITAQYHQQLQQQQQQIQQLLIGDTGGHSNNTNNGGGGHAAIKPQYEQQMQHARASSISMSTNATATASSASVTSGAAASAAAAVANAQNSSSIHASTHSVNSNSNSSSSSSSSNSSNNNASNIQQQFRSRINSFKMSVLTPKFYRRKRTNKLFQLNTFFNEIELIPIVID